MCVRSLIHASDLISKEKTITDGRLFLIKHLLILREQIAPFNVDFAVKEMVIDFSKLKEAAMKFLAKKSKLLSINRDNAFLEFLLQGTLQVKESFIDSKREVDKQLKQSCESYIADLSQQLSGNIRQYLDKAQVIVKLNHDQTNQQKVSLRQQPFAKAEVLHDLIIENYNTMKKQLPEIFKIMSLYLANKDTEQILFKPIKVRNRSYDLVDNIRYHRIRFNKPIKS
jgi:conserved oligomeric Golgi complex subunit 3